jgi:hypothetical protein
MIQAFIPPFIREFLPYISPRALKVIPVKGVGGQAFTVTKRLMTGEGTAQLKKQLEPHLPEKLRFATHTEVKGMQRECPLERLSADEKREAAQKILDLYFMQIHRGEELFLDLRARHFSWKPEGRDLLWSPSALWIQWDPEFHKSLLDLYAGFYEADDSKLDHALNQLKLLSSDSPAEERERMKGLLKEHFGGGEQREVDFKIDRLKHSFHEIFGELETMGRRLPADFAFLGIYITSLYLALEELGQTLNPRQAYFATRDEHRKQTGASA